MLSKKFTLAKMLLLRTLVVFTCVVLTIALNTPPRIFNIQGASLISVENVPRKVEVAKVNENKGRLTLGPLLIQGPPAPPPRPWDIETTTTTSRPTTSMPQSLLRALCVTPRGKFQHPLDCRKYVDCWDGRVLEKRCPNDLVFSDLPGEFCDYLEYVDCGIRPVLTD